MSKTAHYPLVLGLLLALQACQNDEDKAAKARVFSPPPPNPILERAKSPVDLARFASDDTYRTDVLGAQFPEIAARAKAGRFTVKESLTLSRGGAITVEELGHITFNTQGDMDVELKTGTTESMQLVYANGVLFLRNRGGAFRASRDPTDERHFWADQTYSALRTTTEMFKDSLAVKPTGSITLDGRKASRFEILLKGAPTEPDVIPDDVDAGLAPGTRLPDGGVLLRKAFDRRRVVQGARASSLSGFIIMDNETGVPLRVSLEGTLRLAGKKTTEPGSMTIKLETDLTELGKEIEIKAPAEAVEEIVRKRVPVSPLEFLDGGAAKSKPGVKKVPAPVEPPDEEDVP